MSRKIYGRPIATPINPEKFSGGAVTPEQIEQTVENYLRENTVECDGVKTVNGIDPDENGNVNIEIPEGIATEDYVQQYVGDFAQQNLQGIATQEYVQNFVVGFAEENLQGLATQQYVQNYVGSMMAEPVSINLSAYESDGRIVETFADGSSVTTVMEFDDNGRPTKITDSNSNVTTLTW